MVLKESLWLQVGLWTLWLGHTLTFAVVFTRTWMLYSASSPLVGQTPAEGLRPLSV